MVMESMYALLMFLLAIPEHARVNMTEAAAEVLLHEGLVDSASCLFGNVASASPQDSLVTEILYRRSLDIEPVNPVTGEDRVNVRPRRPVSKAHSYCPKRSTRSSTSLALKAYYE